MAITRLADVFPAHRRRVMLMTLALQSVLLVVLAILLTGTGFDWVTTVVYFLLPVAVLQIFAFIIIGNYALEPLDYLSRTVTQLSDQPHDTTPPNLNGTRHERTGFKLMIDTIYARAVTGSKNQDEPSGQTLQAQLLDGLPGGVIALSDQRQVTYSNEIAPVMTDTNGVKSIQLDFDAGDTLEDWLNIVEISQVKAQKIWMRVQSAPPGSDDRRVYDVVANYQKNAIAGADTLILLFDQTARYAVSENALDFMALAAHELRGPITVIRGYLDILRPELGELNADQSQLFDRLEVSSSRLSGYISNILNAAKFDRRHLKLHLREDRVADVLALVSDDLALRASTQGRLLSMTIPDDLPTIAADRNSLSEVIANLVDNGIKYSHEGGQVLVSAAIDGDSVRFSVQDFGIGIPGSVIGNLFTKFYRSHRSKHTVAGTGLGLYISKAIVESHGGKMSVTSTEGQGSTFSFSVPIYATVKDKLLAGGDENQGIIETSSGWIKNHSMYRG
ncbi:MAG: HAMP domain-containing sensor histidine kinase [Candidatus Saccharimonadales bacterium]